MCFGIMPLYILALAMFIWLVVGGFVITKLVTCYNIDLGRGLILRLLLLFIE